MVSTEGATRACQPEICASYPRDSCVHEVFTAVAAGRPGAVALIEGDRELTYGDVDARTNQIARRMQQLGVVPGSVVGFLSVRCIDTLLGWLAALKCGAIYMPLDPSYPIQALEHPIGEANPVVIFAQRSHFDIQQTILGRQAHDLEHEWSEAEHLSDAPLPEIGAATDAAYVMYTSGSTGRPKGVLVTHRGILRLNVGQELLTLDAADCTLFAASLTFDVCTRDVWGALLNGGRLAIVSGTRVSVHELADAIVSYDVTVFNTTAALFHLLVEHSLETLGRLRVLIVGGDVMSVPRALEAVRAHPTLNLYNAYGPTENATISTWFRVPAEGWGDGPVPIGRALSNSSAYVLDDQRRPVAAGEAGTLWVGGDGVALGYLKRPDLTCERFCIDPFRAEVDARMYNTGDLARLRADGNIEFIGRQDRQVKIAGKRIELDEIEHVIRQNTDVADAAVVLQHRGGDDKRIIAFAAAVSTAARLRLTQALALQLRETLPEHMIPAALHILDELPITTNGKIDRAALIARAVVDVPAQRVVDDPHEDIESRLIAIWKAALKIERVGRTDNFFDLGGRSLQILEVHAELRRTIAPDIAVIELFRRPTIANLAAYLKSGGASDTEAMTAAKDRAAQQKRALARARSQRTKTAR